MRSRLIHGIVAALLAVAAITSAPGLVAAQACPPAPGALTCAAGGFVSCGQGESYDAGTPLLSLPTPLDALGRPMAHPLKCSIDGVATTLDGATLAGPLACPLATQAPEQARICKCGVCTAAAVPAIGFCSAADTPEVTCTNKNISCTAGQTLSAASFGCTTSLPSDKVTLLVNTKPTITCSANNKVHIVSAVSDAGCYSVSNTGVYTYAGDDETIPQNPCDSCTAAQVCYQGQCCLGTGDLQVTLEWDGNSNLDLELNHLGCITNPQFPTGNAHCSSALLPTGRLSPVMDRISGATTCAGPILNSCAAKGVENIYIPTLGNQKLFMVVVKGTSLCAPVPYTLSMKFRSKFVTINGVVQPGFFPQATHALWDFPE